ncbi:SusC/RagA family TonB-linked outer membrane protein [Deminuibacter soli]|nr:SusC/RagA family TonB-linked outer membrane protein [Deminuibacter soli]
MLFSLFAMAQGSPKTVNGKLLGLDGTPQSGYTLQSKALQSQATTADDGRFSLKTNAGDSIIIIFQSAKLGAFKLPDMDNFQVQFAEGNKFKFTPLAAATPAADSSGVGKTPQTDSLKKDTGVVNAPHDSTAAVPHDSTKTAAVPDTSKTGDSVMVKGTATDFANHPIAFVNVTYSNGKSYTGTESGTFSIPFKPGETVKFSAVGYEAKTVVLTAFDKPLPVQLNSAANTQQLQEVKVTALGLSKKGKAVGYSVQEVKGDVVQTAKETNFVNALQGRLSGVQINGNSGSMGGSTKVTIRGNKSITGNNNALFVVDGIFMGNNNPVPSYNQQIGGGGYDYGSPIQDINPDDIDQVSVLKGAAATALYGSRGSNGVVLITTKKGGGSGGKLGITYSFNAQMDKVYKLPGYQNRYGGGSANLADPNFVASSFDTLWYSKNPEQFASGQGTYTDPVKGGYDLMPQFAADESWGPELKGQVIRPYYSFDRDKNNPYFGTTSKWLPQPDNVRDFYRTGLTFTNSVSVGGSSDKGTFRLSYSNLSQKFMLPNANNSRNNLGFNGTYKVNSAITALASANYSVNRATGRPGTGFSGTNPTEVFSLYSQRQLEIDKLKYYQFPDGSQVSWNRKSFSDPTPASATTPYWTANKGYESDNRSRLFGMAGVEVKATSWLNLSGKVFLDQFSTLQEERIPKDYQTGGYTRTDRTFQELNYQFLATVRKDIGKKFDITATAGGNIMQQRDEINTGTFTGLIVPDIYNYRNAAGRVTYTPYLFRKQINSVFGDVTIGYMNSVYLELTGRNDWASTLPAGNNSYFYPSASLSAVFSDWVKWKWLSFGKFRASVAQIGSDTDPYRTQLAYGIPGLFGSNPIIAKDPNLNNNQLLPEKSTEVEAGLELKFLNNRVGLDATVYSRTTKNLIVPLQVSPTSGYNYYFANIGKSRSRGLEIELTGRPVESKNFTWDIGVNYSMNRSKLLALNVPNNPDVDRYIVGTERRRNSVSTAAIVGQPLFVLTGTDYTRDAGGNKILDTSGHYVPTDATHIIGSTQPKFVGGVSNSFTYKHISLSALIDFQNGGSFFSYTNMYGLASGLLDVTAANNIRETGITPVGVTADGKESTKHISAADHFKNNFGTNVNAANVYDASYVYLREVRLGYELPERWAKAIKGRTIKISLYGRNLWLIHSNAPNVDPSNIINSDSNIQGLEGGALPSTRTYGVNLNVGF